MENSQQIVYNVFINNIKSTFSCCQIYSKRQSVPWHLGSNTNPLWEIWVYIYLNTYINRQHQLNIWKGHACIIICTMLTYQILLLPATLYSFSRVLYENIFQGKYVLFRYYQTKTHLLEIELDIFPLSPFTKTIQFQ